MIPAGNAILTFGAAVIVFIMIRSLHTNVANVDQNRWMKRIAITTASISILRVAILRRLSVQRVKLAAKMRQKRPCANFWVTSLYNSI